MHGAQRIGMSTKFLFKFNCIENVVVCIDV